MKPQARPFTVEIKRTKRPVHSKFSLTAASTLRPGDRPLRERPTRDTRPDDTIREAASKLALSEVDRVFGRLVTPVLVATPTLNGIDLPRNADPQLFARSGVAAATPTHDAEGSGSEKPCQGRVLPDLLSAAREEERAREAQMLLNGRRLPQCPRTPARPKTAQPEAVQPEEPVRSRRLWNARAVESQGEAVPPRPEVAAFVATAAPDVDQAPVSAEPSGAGRGNAVGLLPRKVKRVGQPIPLRAGERWKRRLPPVCR
jgi:hypothetical protein